MPATLDDFDPEQAIRTFNQHSSELGEVVVGLIDRSYDVSDRHFDIVEAPYEFMVAVDQNTDDQNMKDIVMARYERTIHVYMGASFTISEDLEGVKAVVASQFPSTEWTVEGLPDRPTVEMAFRQDGQALYEEVAPLFNRVGGHRFQVPLADIDQPDGET